MSPRVVMGLLFFPRGGSAQVARYMARAMPEAGWDVTLVTGSLGGGAGAGGWLQGGSRAGGGGGRAAGDGVAGGGGRAVDRRAFFGGGGGGAGGLLGGDRGRRPVRGRPAAPPLVRGPPGRAGQGL